MGRRRLHSRVLAALHSPTPLAMRALAACDFLLAEGAAICRRAGARLAVLTIPSPETLDPSGLRRLVASQPDGPPLDPDLPDASLAATCSRLGLPLVVGRRVFGLEHFRADGHWNIHGHRRVAGLLDDLYRQVREDAAAPAGRRGRRAQESRRARVARSRGETVTEAPEDETPDTPVDEVEPTTGEPTEDMVEEAAEAADTETEETDTEDVAPEADDDETKNEA